MTFNLKDYYNGNLSWLCDRTIFLAKHGSYAYGMATPESDLDVRGICIPPKDYILGCSKGFEQAEIKGDPDVVIYDLRKFLTLASQCNPNIIELMYIDPTDWLLAHPLFEKLRTHRSLFLTKRAKYSFSGYAISQLKRIKTHRRWLLHPVEKQPQREDFDLPKMQKIPKDQIGAFNVLVEREKINKEELPQNFLLLIEREKAYQHAKKEWEQYQNWKNTRNPKRAEIEAKYGYDCKHAAHLVRLMRQCREILTTGTLTVKRPDAEELLSIRNGAWNYDKLMEWTDQQDKELEEIYNTCTILPHSPNLEKINELCVEILEESLSTL